MNLLSDAAQSQTWPTVAPLITKGKTLYFSHGFSVVYKEDTKVIPPKDVDVILVAPKGSGRTVRTLFKEGRGINSSVAVFQDVTGKAMEKAVAIGVAVGSGYMYETTFEKEVYSDLYGERGVLMGAIRKCSHTASYSQLMICQRVCSARSTRCSVPMATLLRKPSMKPSRRPLNLCIP
jgi:ketol-acid reductoisomerase